MGPDCCACTQCTDWHILRRFSSQLLKRVTEFCFWDDWGKQASPDLPASKGMRMNLDYAPNFPPKPRKSTNGRLMNMQGGFLIRHSRLTAVGIMLCLLIALFAVEAKIAWFSPAGSASAQISFAKARPAEPPKSLPQRFAAPELTAHDFAGTAALLAVALLLVTITKLVAQARPAWPQVSASPGFSASLFFRPPPAL